MAASETNFVFGDIPAATADEMNVRFVKEGGDPDRYSGNLPFVKGDAGDGGGPGLVPAPNPGDAAAGKMFHASGFFQVPRMSRDNRHGTAEIISDQDPTSADDTSVNSRGMLVTFDNVAAIAVALDSGVAAGFMCAVLALAGAGVVTLTPSSGTINGVASLAVTEGFLFFNGTNWRCIVLGGGGSVSPLTTKGDLYTRSASADDRLAVGANGKVLMADSTQTLGIKWTSLVEGDISGLVADLATLASSIAAKMTNPMTTLGDIIHGGAAGVPTRLAAGSAGLVLTSNGAGSAPSYQSVGSIALPPWLRAFVDIYPTSPSAYDDEFDANSANAAWTVAGTNAGVSYNTFLPGAAIASLTSGSHSFSLTKPVSLGAGDISVTSLLFANPSNGFQGSIMSVGDTTGMNANSLNFSYQYNSNNVQITTYKCVSGSYTFNIFQQSNLPPGLGKVYFHFQRISGVWQAYWKFYSDGLWQQLSSNLGFAPTVNYVQLVTQQNTATTPMNGGFGFIRCNWLFL